MIFKNINKLKLSQKLIIYNTKEIIQYKYMYKGLRPTNSSHI